MSAPVRVAEIEIPEPCHEDWDRMRPEERGRFCAACKKTVHDLSAMTEAQGRAFLAASAQVDVCVSYESVGDRVQFRPAQVVPIGRLRRRPAAAAGIAAGLTLALAACAPHGEPPAMTLHVDEGPVVHTPVVVPSGTAPKLRDAPPVEVEVEAEPCDPVPAAEPVPVHRVKGTRVRTAGKPVRPRNPLAGL